MQKFRQSSIVFKKPGILPENLKTLSSSNYPTAQYFFPELRTRFLLTNAYKRMCGMCGSYLQKLKKTWFLHTRFLHLTQDLNENKKKPDTLL